MPLGYPDPPLGDEVVALRAWSAADLATVVEASRDPYIPKVTTVPAPLTRDAGERWLERQDARSRSGIGVSLAIAETSTRGAVGAVVLMHRGHGLYGLGYWLLRAARGRGLASRAVALVAPWALAQPEVAGLEALVEPWNEASSRVVERGLLSVISGLALCGFHLLDARYSQPLPKAGEDFVLPIPLAGEPVLQRAASPGRRRGVAASR